MRIAGVLVLLAGCQVVFPLDVETDEDGDGESDDSDGCPHIANEDPTDTDGDGAADECDLDPAIADEHVFFSFRDGRPLELKPLGPVTAIDGGLEIGDAADNQANHDGVVLDVGARAARVELGVEILARADPVPGFEEIAVFIQHGNFQFDTAHGEPCFVGRDMAAVQPNYLQMPDGGMTRFDGELADEVSGRLSMTLYLDGEHCSVERGSPDRVIASDQSFVPDDVAGKIAITTTFLKIRIEYLWVVYTTEPLASRLP